MKSYINIFLNFFISWFELVRKPTLHWVAKALLVAALGTLSSLYLTVEIPVEYLGVTVKFGGGDSGTFLLLMCLSLAIFGYIERRERKEADDSQLIIVRHMGLVDHGIGDIRNFLPKKIKRIRPQPFAVIHPNSNKTTSKEELDVQLENICRLPHFIKDSGETLNNAKKHILYGGVAPVPMVATAGHIVSNMQDVHVGDWSRKKKKWHFNNEFDDGEELVFKVEGNERKDASTVSIAISFSIPADLVTINKEFPDSPLHVVTVKQPKLKYDSLCSKDKQDRFAIEILEFINNNIIPEYPNLNLINLFVTAQASFVFRLGSVLHQGHLPRILFHHFDRDSDGKKHPWGVLLNDNKQGYKVVA